MTFLELVKELRRRSGLQGTGPATVVGATGESLQLVNWVADSWRKIQLHRRGWKWMRADASTQTAASDGSYSPTSPTEFNLTRFGHWRLARDSFSCYLTATGVSDEQRLLFMPYDDFRSQYQFGAQTDARPQFFTIDPQDNILLGPKPDDVYTVRGEYIKSPQLLAADADVPECPAKYHMAIVFRALMRYAVWDNAPEVFQDAKDNYEEEMARLDHDQLESVTVFDETLA